MSQGSKFNWKVFSEFKQLKVWWKPQYSVGAWSIELKMSHDEHVIMFH